jgi:hypothetical protein
LRKEVSKLFGASFGLQGGNDSGIAFHL